MATVWHLVLKRTQDLQSVQYALHPLRKETLSLLERVAAMSSTTMADTLTAEN